METERLPRSSNDAANLVLLFQTLRSLVPDARLAMDAQITGIVGPDGNYLTDLTPFANTLDCESLPGSFATHLMTVLHDQISL